MRERKCWAAIAVATEKDQSVTRIRTSHMVGQALLGDRLEHHDEHAAFILAIAGKVL